MASMRDIKRRRAGIQSTEQITKAIKLVTTVKLQESRVKAENSKPYFNLMYKTISSMLQKSGIIHHKYLQPGDTNKKTVVAITSNRGLASGYSNDIVKLVSSELPAADTYVYAVGKRGRDGLIQKEFEVKADYHNVISESVYRSTVDIALELLDPFVQGQIGEVYLAYASFKNTAVHESKLTKLFSVGIDLSKVDSNAKADTLMSYESADEEVLDVIVPKYMSSLIYGASLKAAASENEVRMTAMNSATSNTEKMIGALNLQYSRARQGVITQELTEVIAGANAVD